MVKRSALLILLAVVAPACALAQSFEPFTKVFSLPASVSNQIIPMCSTGSTGCIPDYKQVSHSVTLTMSTPAACGFLLDASSDNSIFNTIAANSTGGMIGYGTIKTVTAQANGYYPYLRIKVLPCSYAVSVSYTGYSNSQQINFTGYPSVIAVTSYGTTGLGYLTPTVLQGLSCTNTDSANTAWLHVLANAATRIAPDDFILMETGIGPSATWNYFGPPINLLGVTQTTALNYLYFGAFTTSSGATPVTNPVLCNFQSNGSGPYYPFFPLSP
jgi:hypothetical protein